MCGSLNVHIAAHPSHRTAWRSVQWRSGCRHMGDSTDICLLEICAVLLSLRMIKRASHSLLHDIERVTCIIDNRPVVQWLAGNWQVLNSYTRHVLIDVYKEMQALHETFLTLFVQ